MYTAMRSPGSRDEWYKSRQLRVQRCQLGFSIASFVFLVLLVAFVAIFNPLGDTTNATLRMDTRMENLTLALNEIQSKFPANQKEVTVGQMIETVANVHETVAWVNDLHRRIDPKFIPSIVKSVESITRSVSTILEQDHDGDGKTLLADVHELLDQTKAIDMAHINTVVEHAGTTLGEVTRLLSQVRQEDVAATVHMLQTIDSDHLVDVLTQLGQTTLEIANHLKQNPTLEVQLWQNKK